MNSIVRRVTGLAALSLLTAYPAAWGQTWHVWDGGGANNNWGTAANWNPDGAPPNPTTNFVSLAGTTRLAPVVNTDWTILGLFISNNAGAFVLSGSNITVTASQIDQNRPHVFENRSTNTIVINNQYAITATTNARRQFVLGSSGGVTFNGIITNANYGSGLGDIWIRGNAGGGGAATVIGTLNGRVLLGTNKLSKLDTVTWVIGTNGNAWGNTDIYHTGVLRVAATDALPTNTLVTFNAGSPGGRLDLNNFNQTVAGLAAAFQSPVPAVRTGTNAGGRLTINSDSRTNLYFGSITENGSVWKMGTSRLILMTNSTFAGNLVIAGGVLQVGTNRSSQHFNALGATPAATGGRTVTIDSGATLEIRGRDVPTSTNVSFFINGTLTNESFSTIGPVTLGNGRIDGGPGYNTAGYQNLAFRSSVTVTGTAPSYITGMTGSGNAMHLESTQVVFDVANVTGDSAADLVVSAVLGNGSPNVNTAGGLIKQGAGTMQLDGHAVFNGTARVAAGTLALGASGSASNATLLTDSGGVLDVTAVGTFAPPAQMVIGGNGVVTGTTITLDGGTILTPGLPGLAGSLTVNADVVMSGTGTYTNLFDLTNNLTAGGGNDLLTVNGNTFEPMTSSQIRINPLAPLTAGTYRLINYAAPVKTTTFAAPVLGNTTRDTWSLDESTPGQIDLIVTQGVAQSLVWGGLVSSNWDIGLSTNWTATPGPSPDAFYDLDTVLFDDTGAASNLIHIAGVVRPASVTVNSSSNYTFSGPGRIKDMGNATWLTKDGTGALVVITTNDYSGVTIVSNGTLQLGSGGGIGNVGAGTVHVDSPGVLTHFRNDGGYNIGNTIVGGGTLVFQGPGGSGQGGYTITGINTGFFGTVMATNARVQADAATDLGNAAQFISQERGQLYVVNVAVTQSVQITGIGWQETAGRLGAIRLQGGTLNGPVTLTGHARIGAYSGNGFINNQITGDYELEYWNGEAANARTINVGSPVPHTYASMRVSSNIIVVATNANAFAGSAVVLNGGVLRVNGNSFAFSNLSSTAAGGQIQNASTGGDATLTVGADGADSAFTGSMNNAPTQPLPAQRPLHLTKVGAGALTLANNGASGTNSVTQGTVVLANGTWSGPLAISAGATVVAAGGQGLAGEFYNVTATQANLNTLSAFNRDLAQYAPAMLFKSTAAISNSMDFAPNGSSFPPGYNTGSPVFQGRWIGKFDAGTNAGLYTFSTASDDGSALYIDGAMVVSNNLAQGVTERTGTVTLAAGKHDITVAYNNTGGGYGFYVQVIPPGGAKARLTNTLLSSGSAIGALSGASGSQLIVSNGLLLVSQGQPGTFDGSISGDGGILKAGPGMLTLNGNNTYTDTTTVVGGSLVANNNLGSGPVSVQISSTLGGTGVIAGAVTLQDGATLQQATLGDVGTLTLGGDLTMSAGASNIYDFSATTNDFLAVGGTLAAAGASVYLNPWQALANGLYPLASYGTLGSAFNPQPYNLNSSATGAKRLSLDYGTPNLVLLSIGAGKTLTWNSPNNGNWAVQTSNDWKDGVAPTNEPYYQGDAVVFDDTPGVTQVVTIGQATDIWPASITVSTDTNAFTLGIAGALRGNFAVVKNGTNTFTMNDTTGGAGANQNFGGGGVTVNNGRLILLGQNDGARTAGSGLLTVNATGSLQTDSANTLGQQGTGILTPVLLDGGRFRPGANNHMNQLILQNNAVVERYNSAGGAGLDFYAVTGTPAQIHVLATPATITNDARMSINNSVTNTVINVVDSGPAIDAQFSAQISGVNTRYIVLTNSGTLLLSGPNDNNSLMGIIENGTLLLGKTGATSRAFGGNPGDGLILRGNSPTVRLVGPGPDQIYANVGVRIDAGTLDLNGFTDGFNHLNGSGGTILNGAAGTVATNVIGENNGSGLYGGVIQDGAGTVALAKAGTGVQVLTNANTYTGGTVIRAGTLALSNSLGNAIVGDVQVGVGAANAVLRIDLPGQLPDSAALAFASGGAGTSGKLQLMGNTETIAGLAITSGTISVIQNAENETVDTDARLVVDNAATNISVFDQYIRDRAGGTGTGRLHLVKAGPGALVIGGANQTYSGDTTVSNGVLAVIGPLANSAVTLDGGSLIGSGTLGRDLAVNSGATVQPGYLTVSAPLAASSNVALASGSTLSLIANGTGSILRVDGVNGLTIPSAGNVTVGVGPVASTGVYVVVDYDGAIQGGTVAANLSLMPYPRTAATLVDNVANSTIDLDVTALGEAIKWTGANNGTWDINTTTNWQTQAGLAPTAYLQPVSIGDSVLFDDSAAGNFAITIPAGVNPAALAVSNSANDYSWTGAGIGGASGLIKDGTARLSILTSNTFAGATIIKAGTLTIASEGSLGLAPVTLNPSQLVIQAGAKLEFVDAGGAIAASRGIAIGTPGTLGSATLDIGPANATIWSPVINNGTATGGLAKAGGGVLTLATSNRFTGPISVQAGTLKVGALGALGPVAGNTITVASNACVAHNGIQQAGRNYLYFIAGSGPDGRGAIINTNGTLVGNSTLRWLDLTGDATIGALGNFGAEGNRMDVYNVDGHGFTLTKAGHSSVSMRQSTTNLQVVVNEGFVYTEFVSDGLGTNNIVNTGGYLGAYGNVPGRLLLQPVVLNGGTLASRSGFNAGAVTWAGPVTLTAHSTIATRTPQYATEEGINIAGDITGSFGLNFYGTASNIVLTGNNTYAGPNFITNGVFVQLGTNSPNGSMNGDITNNGNLVINRSDTYNLAGVLAGSGNLNQYGTGTSILTAAGSTLSGTINVTNGLLIFDGGSLTTTGNVRNIQIGRGAVAIITNNASLTLAGHVHLGTYGSGSSGTLYQYSGSLVINGFEAGNGNRALQIGEWPQETSTYHLLGGSTLVTNGVTFLPWNATQGVWNVENATAVVHTLRFNSGSAGNGILNLSSGRFSVGPGGIIRLSGTSTINLDGGTIAAWTNWGTSVGMTLTGSNAPATFDTADWTITLSNVLSGAGGLVKLGTGTLVTRGVNTFTGPTTVSNGTLLVMGSLSTGDVTIATGATLAGTGNVNGAVTGDGAVSPGASVGVLSVAAYNQLTGGVLNIELAGVTTPGIDYDQLLVAGAANLNGTLNVTLTNGFTPSVGDQFLIMQAGSIGGTFAATNLPSLGTNVWNVEYPGGLFVILSVTNPPSPPLTGYDLFASQIQNPADRGYLNDPDIDGYANLLEYVTGGSPTNADTVARMTAVRTNGTLALKFTRSITATDATFYVEAGYAATNDAPWAGIATNIAGSWGTAPNVSETGGPDPVDVTVEDTDPAATNRFLRLRVTRP